MSFKKITIKKYITNTKGQAGSGPGNEKHGAEGASVSEKGAEEKEEASSPEHHPWRPACVVLPLRDAEEDRRASYIRRTEPAGIGRIWPESPSVLILPQDGAKGSTWM